MGQHGHPDELQSSDTLRILDCSHGRASRRLPCPPSPDPLAPVILNVVNCFICLFFVIFVMCCFQFSFFMLLFLSFFSTLGPGRLDFLRISSANGLARPSWQAPELRHLKDSWLFSQKSQLTPWPPASPASCLLTLWPLSFYFCCNVFYKCFFCVLLFLLFLSVTFHLFFRHSALGDLVS